MRLLNKLTLRSLRLNMKRTIVTIIGIILATSLLSAVSTMVVSFQGSMVEHTREEDGNYHYAFYNVPLKEASSITQNRKVDSYFAMAGIGYAKLPGSVNPDKPYLYLAAMDRNGFARGTVHLTEGRLPENSKEVIISKHIKTNGGVTYHVGDVLTLDIGKRYLKDEKNAGEWAGKPLNQLQSNPEGYDTETLRTEFTKSYTIVGITERLSRKMEDQMAPGYTILTYLDQSQWDSGQPYDGVDIFARYTDAGIRDRLRTTADILGIDPELYAKATKNELTDEELKQYKKMQNAATISRHYENSYLIRYETLDFGNSAMSTLYIVAAVVMLIIVFASAFCIQNSFAISITEKMRQYGMLSSVGATPKQIRKNVYYEAAVLAAIGIPVGIFSGLFASWVLVKIMGILLADTLNVDIILHTSGFALGISSVFAAITILFSAAMPARRAGKVSPIVAINNSSNVKLTHKALRMPGYIKKIFGIGGTLAYKNMKRNKKSYRVVVISMVVSVSVFVALSYFMQLAFTSTSYYLNTYNHNLQVYAGDIPYEDMKKIVGHKGVKQASIIRSSSIVIAGKSMPFTKDGLKYAVFGEDGTIYINIYSVGGQAYSRFLEELGISAQETEDAFIYINKNFLYDPDKEQYFSYDITTMKKGDTINGSMTDVTEENVRRPASLKIACVTDKRPSGLENISDEYGFLIASDKWMNRHANYRSPYATIYMDCEDPDAIQDEIIKNKLAAENDIYNLAQEQRNEKSIFTVIAIFLYGFITVISLIGITNIFNTVTKNMELRSREFAMLRSIGMTKKEFNRMVCMESIFYGGKSLFFGLIIGTALSYAIYRSMAEGIDTGFQFPLTGALIAALAVALLLFGIMRYSLVRIRRQNIIETIRQENI